MPSPTDIHFPKTNIFLTKTFTSNIRFNGLCPMCYYLMVLKVFTPSNFEDGLFLFCSLTGCIFCFWNVFIFLFFLPLNTYMHIDTELPVISLLTWTQMILCAPPCHDMLLKFNYFLVFICAEGYAPWCWKRNDVSMCCIAWEIYCCARTKYPISWTGELLTMLQTHCFIYLYFFAPFVLNIFHRSLYCSVFLLLCCWLKKSFSFFSYLICETCKYLSKFQDFWEVHCGCCFWWHAFLFLITGEYDSDVNGYRCARHNQKTSSPDCYITEGSWYQVNLSSFFFK